VAKVKPKNNVEIKKMEAAGKLAAETLDMIAEHVKPGVSTEELNTLCHNFIVERGGIPAPLNYRGFPKSVCTSKNEVICHGIPSEEDILADGDIVNIDVTAIVDGFHGDTSRMFFVGNVSKERQQLVKDTYDAMMLGINTVRSGSMLSDIGKAIQEFAEAKGYGVVRDYCGHGIGRIFHEQPMVLHYDPKDPRLDMRLRKGMTFTIEPMINVGTYDGITLDDDWTVITADGKDSAQFEHTIVVTDTGCEILTKSPKGLDCPPYSA
tara:strand:+ start:636876 stop:637670 length:795 start_codon:yes stop_codon:yes gene_type:complete